MSDCYNIPQQTKNFILQIYQGNWISVIGTHVNNNEGIINGIVIIQVQRNKEV